MSNTTQPLPNPDTYLNHFSPDDAARFEVVRIIHATFLGAIVWDIFAFIPEDVKILGQGGGLVITFCYLLTRITAAVCVVLWVIMEARPISHCEGMLICTNVTCILTMATSSYLFLKRAQAVYSGNRLAQLVFAFTFVCANLSNLLPLFSVTMTHIPGTGYCAIDKVELFGTTSYFMTVFFDSLIFFSISYRIAYLNQNNVDTQGNWVTRLFTSKTLPLLSKAIIQGGQKYYLVDVISRITALAMTFAPSVPPGYWVSSMSPSVVVTAIMVCRAHRDMVLVFHSPDGDVSGLETRVMTSIQFAHVQPVSGETTSTVVIKSLLDTVDSPKQKVFEARVERSPPGNVV